MADTQLVADPSSISTLVTSQDADRIAAAIAARYGFLPPAAYCADLAAFVLATEAHIAALERRLSVGPEDEEAMMRFDHA
jgi:hypothetical protein